VTNLGHKRPGPGLGTAPRSVLRPILAGLGLTLVSLLVFAATPAFAFQTHVFSTSFGTSGSGDGQVSSPQGVAVNSTTHDVYVADTGNARIDQFDSSGAFIRAFGADVGGSGINVCTSGCVAGTVGSAAGQFTLPTFIAVDNSGGASQGDVYVGDTGTNLVQKFDASGNLIASWGNGGQLDGSTATDGPFGALAGVTVDPSGSLWVYDQNGQMFEFAQDGTFTQDWNSGRGVTPAGIAVDSVGNLYVATLAVGVTQFTSSGTQVGDIDDSFSSITGIAVDPSTNDLYVDGSGTSIRHYDSSCDPSVGCTPADTFGLGDLSNAAGLAVDSSNHGVFATDTGNSRLDLFIPVTLADATTGSASPLAATSATLNGHLDPAGGGDVSDCHFEWGLDTSYGNIAPCAEGNSFSSPSDVHADLSGLTPETAYHFRLDVTDAQGTNTGADQPFTTPPAVAGLSTDPATNVGPTTATLNGSLDPAGEDTTYHFQYTTSSDFAANGYANATTVPIPDADAGSTPGEVAVTPVDISGLTQDTSYTFRIVASNADGTTLGNNQAFSTPPPPSIDGVAAVNLTPTDADLTAQVNPNGLDTTYHFEYGTGDCSANPCASVPVPDADIGAGTTDVSVSQHISGLSPNITYHFRIIATNPSGTVGAAVDHTFIYDTTGRGLPDGRAYEMVTPPNKNGTAIGHLVFGGAPDVSEAGSRVIISSIQCFADAASCTATRQVEGSPYAFTRTGGGWVTSALAPPATQYAGNSAWLVSADAGTALFTIPTPPAGQDDWYARQPDGSFVDIGPTTPPSLGAIGPEIENQQVVPATADLSHVVFGLPNSALWSFDASSNDSAYEYAGAGNAQPLLLGVSGSLGSTDLISICNTYPGQQGLNYNTISADGRIVYFTAAKCASGSGANAGAPVPADALYARVDGELPSAHTVPISEHSPADCTTGACLGSSPGDAAFQGASADGSKAFFTSTQQLTDNASEDPETGDSSTAFEGCSTTSGPNGCNLYLYDFSASTGHELVDVSAGDSSGHGPRVQGVAAISSDGSHVYFVAKGVLTAAPNSEGQTASDGADNLYAYERDASQPSGHTAFVGTLLPADDQAQSAQEWSAGPIFANVTPNGRFLAFTSAANLTPGIPANGAQQIFRYDSQTGDLVRISVGDHGFNDNGNAGVGDASIVAVRQFSVRAGPARPDPSMSHDGAYVFFQSPIALTPHALNDVQIGVDGRGHPRYAENVYEDHNGDVSLISDGTDVGNLAGFSNVSLLGTDASGANVFFRTADPLVPQDTDTQIDFYDARIGGGFPFTPPPEPCNGDSCKPPPSSTPPDQTFGSSGLNGPGNQGRNLGGSTKLAKKCKKGKKGRKCRKARHASTSRTAGR
jgi:NHL repeat